MMQLTIFLAAVIAVGTILYGVKMMKSQKAGNLRNTMLTSIGLFSAMIIMFTIAGTGDLMAAEAAADAAGTALSFGDGLKYVAAALSTGLATMGTGRAVGSVGASAIGAVSEDSTILGKTLIFVGMAEGIAIYGMIISILILFI
nr:ATP synthase subunit C [uncultured Cellulosilyticum sp.]